MDLGGRFYFCGEAIVFGRWIGGYLRSAAGVGCGGGYWIDDVWLVLGGGDC